MKMASVIKSVRNGTFFKKAGRKISNAAKWLSLPFLKVNYNKVVCDNFGGLGFGCNPKYIVKALHSRNAQADIVWLIDYQRTTASSLPDYVRPVDVHSVDALVELASAGVWISNYRSKIINSIKKKRSQFYIQTWHGNFGPKKSERDSENSLPASYVKLAKRDSSRIDLCISNGNHVTAFYKNTFWYKGKILECGSPRNDVLLDERAGISIKSALNLAGKKICLYAPTFRRDLGLQYYDIDYHLLKRALEEKFDGEWCVLIRLHPNVAGKASLLGLPSDVQDVTRYPDSQELLAASDCVITDFSSIVYDYIFTGKPVFIYANDYERYVRDDRGLYFKLSDTPFSIAQDNETLSKNIQDFDCVRYKSDVLTFLKLHGVFERGTASDTVAKKILEEMQAKK